MNVISKQIINEYTAKNAGAKTALETWFAVVRKAAWKDLNDLKKDFPSADYVADDRVIFNIRGNHYRLVVRVSFVYKQVMIKWIGTHAEYDKIDVFTV